MSGFNSENTGMDPILFPYSATNGVPQESKLATYMVNIIRAFF